MGDLEKSAKALSLINYSVKITHPDTTHEYITPTTYEGNLPPEKPRVWGPSSPKKGKSYTYNASGVDPDYNDQLYYLFDWGDGDKSDWLGPYPSGTTVQASHTWDDKGNYNIRVQTRDCNEVKSTWSDNMSIKVAKSINSPDGGPVQIPVGESASITVSSDLMSFGFEASVSSCSWDMNNDGLANDASGLSIDWSWSHIGQYVIKAFVLDDEYNLYIIRKFVYVTE